MHELQAINQGQKPLNASTYKRVLTELKSRSSDTLEGLKQLRQATGVRGWTKPQLLKMSIQAIDLLEGRLKPLNRAGEPYPVEGWVAKWSKRLPKEYFGEMRWSADVAQILRVAFIANYSPHCPKGPAECRTKRQRVIISKPGAKKLRQKINQTDSCELRLMYAFRSAKYAGAQEAREYHNSSGVRRGCVVAFSDMALPADFTGDIADHFQSRGINPVSLAESYGIKSPWSDVMLEELKKLLTVERSEVVETKEQGRIYDAFRAARPQETDLLYSYAKTGTIRLAAIAVGMSLANAEKVIGRYRQRIKRHGLD